MNRKIDLTHISTIVDKVLPSSITNSNAADKLLETTKAVEKKAKVVTSDVQNVLKEYCDSNKVDSSNNEFLSKLSRKLEEGDNLGLCEALKSADPISEVLLKGNVNVNNSDFTSLVKNSIDTELAEVGFTGTVPDCLFNNILNKVNLFDKFGRLSPKQKLSILSGLKSSCMESVVEGLAGELVKVEAVKGVINGMMDNDTGKAFAYIAKKATSNDSVTTLISALESSVSEKGSTNIVPKSLALGELLGKYHGPKRVSGINPESFLDNLKNENVRSNYPTAEFKMIENVMNKINVPAKAMRQNKTLKDLAKGFLQDRKPTSTTATVERTTVLDNATKIGLANLF